MVRSECRGTVMFLRQKKLLLLVMLLLLSGCATITAPHHNLMPTMLNGHPVTQISQTKNHDYTDDQTFTILPASTLSEENTRVDVDIAQMHLFFILRNALEGRGYQYVTPSAAPDFIATIEASLEYKENYITPSIVSRSKWKLGDAATSSALNTARLWGEYQQEMTSPTSTNRKTPQGLAGGIYYPQIDVTIFDTKSMAAGWRGTATGASHNPITQVSSQLIVRSLISQIAPSKHRFKNFPPNNGKIGLGFAIVTTDGKNYYPAVTGLRPNTPAKKAGLKNADYIIEINGVSTLNRSTAKIASMLAGTARSNINLKIWRMGNSIKYSIKRIHR